MAKKQPGSAPKKRAKQTWVLDANVLHHAAKISAKGGKSEDGTLQKLALALLVTVHLRHQIAEDSSGRIAKEYKDAWTRISKDRGQYPSYDTAHALWDALWQQRISPPHRALHASLHKLCLEANMKPEGDIAYAEAAAATADGLLATEDSDFTPKIREELQKRHRVQVMGYKAAVDHAGH